MGRFIFNLRWFAIAGFDQIDRRQRVGCYDRMLGYEPAGGIHLYSVSAGHC
jgi:hypothetical protein